MRRYEDGQRIDRGLGLCWIEVETANEKRFILMAGSHSDKTSWNEPRRRGCGAVVLGIVNGPGRHSPDRSFRIGVTTTKNRKAKGSNIAGDNHLDGFSARRSMRHRRSLARL